MAKREAGAGITTLVLAGIGVYLLTRKPKPEGKEGKPARKAGGYGSPPTIKGYSYGTYVAKQYWQDFRRRGWKKAAREFASRINNIQPKSANKIHDIYRSVYDKYAWR